MLMEISLVKFQSMRNKIQEKKAGVKDQEVFQEPTF